MKFHPLMSGMNLLIQLIVERVFWGYKVSLTRDLEFDNISFPPIGNYYQPFRGEFDGMGTSH